MAYPTDSGLLAKGSRASWPSSPQRSRRPGLATRTTFRDRTRSMRRRAHDIGAWLRRRSDDAKAEVQAHQRRDGRHRRRGRAPRPPRRAATPGGPAPRRRRRRTGKTLALLADLERHRRTRRADRRPDPPCGSPVTLPRGRPGSCRSTTPTPARSPRASRPSRRVRLQGPGRRQRRRHRLGPRPPHRQPARRTDARARHRPHHRPLRACPRAVTADRGYGEAAVDPTSKTSASRASPSPARAVPAPPAKPHNAPGRSASSSSGAPAAKPASPASNATTGGGAPASTALPAPHLVRMGCPRPQRHQDQRPDGRSRTTTPLVPPTPGNGPKGRPLESGHGLPPRPQPRGSRDRQARSRQPAALSTHPGVTVTHQRRTPHPRTRTPTTPTSSGRSS